MTTSINSANSSILSNVKGVGKTNALANSISFNSDETVLTVHGVDYPVVPFAGNVQLIKVIGDNAKSLPSDKLAEFVSAVTSGYVSPFHRKSLEGETPASVSPAKGRNLTAIEFEEVCLKGNLANISLDDLSTMVASLKGLIANKDKTTKANLLDFVTSTLELFWTDEQDETYVRMVNEEQELLKQWESLLDAGFINPIAMDNNQVSVQIPFAEMSSALVKLPELGYVLTASSVATGGLSMNLVLTKQGE